jgi:hypothetical protein
MPDTIYGQNCSILSQNVPKFELLKHNDELLNIYYEIFYELRYVLLNGTTIVVYTCIISY